MALASRASAAAVAFVLLALAASAAAAGSHSPAPAPAPAAVDCVSEAATLIDCLDYVTPGSTVRKPPAACCSEVKTAVASPTIVACLCSIAGSKDMAFPIDIKRVLQLPGACGASNAAFSQCNISALTPTGSPTGAPIPSAGGSSSGGAAAASPHAGATSSAMTATSLLAAVAAPLLAYCYLF